MARYLICLLGVFMLLSGTAFGAEFIYRDLMANTLPAPRCEAKAQAIASASQSYNLDRYARRFCETQGYGWAPEQVKDNGKSVCEECSTSDAGKFQCHLEDVVVTCKRLKPGSVGLVPGKG